MPDPSYSLPIAAALLTCLLIPGTAEARLVVDHIVVHGTPKTSPRVLSGRMDIHPGDVVDYARLTSAEKRLLQSELFTAARVYIDMPRDEAARRMYASDDDYLVDVQVEVTEKQSWFVAPTASFGSGDYAGGAVYGDQNLLGHDLQLVAAAQIGQSRSFVFAGYRDPLVVGAPLTWGISGLYRFEQIRYFADHRRVLQVPTVVGGGEVEAGWVLSPHLQALIGFSARSQQVGAPEVLAPDAALPTYNARSGRIFLLVFQVRYDDTTSPEGLRRGVRLLVKNEVSDLYWGSQFDYSKFEARTELYGKLAWNYPSLLLQTVFDYPTSVRGVPITEMLRVGGSNLRGFLVNEFHGDTLIRAQMEDQVVVLRRVPLPFVDTRFNVAAAAFVDVAALLDRHPGGTIVDLPVEPRAKPGDFHTGVGLGLRAILPGVAIPALKADVGYGIDVHSFAVTVSIAGGG
ncbi:MAG: BamA/TamA family outer membrane protein [Deltaproteobacteria bacterium]|nr:BamA/TamA family outer membrane protein [Deltaproteobacteria bacterium]